jgi:hypothetical protein
MNRILLAAAFAAVSSVAALADAGSAGNDRAPERQIMNNGLVGSVARELTLRDRMTVPTASTRPFETLSYFTSF